MSIGVFDLDRVASPDIERAADAVRAADVLESRRHDTDDRARAFVDDDPAADDAGISAIPTLPQSVRENDRRFEPRRGGLIGELLGSVDDAVARPPSTVGPR